MEANKIIITGGATRIGAAIAEKLSGPGSKFAPGNPTKAREFIKQQSDIPFGGGSYNIDMDLIPKDFLETQEDLQQQKAPIELLTT